MSFVQISTENPLGQRPLNLMSRQQGLGWFGLGAAPTPGDYDTNQAVLNQLVSMGAITFQDANDIWAGQASLDDFPVNMTMINSALQFSGQTGAQTVQPLTPSSGSGASAGGGAQVTPYTPTPNIPAPAAAGQIPAGSVISYTVTYSQNISTPAPTQFISAFAAGLAAYRYSMIGGTLISNTALGLGSATIQFQILDSVGNALLTDAKANLDALANRLTYNSVTASTVPRVLSTPGGGTPIVVPNQPQSITQFLENNAGLLAGLMMAIVLAPALIKKL